MNQRSGTRAVAPILVTCFLAWSGLAQEPLMRVSESDARKAVVKKIEPEYPAMARQVRLSGQVQASCPASRLICAPVRERGFRRR